MPPEAPVPESSSSSKPDPKSTSHHPYRRPNGQPKSTRQQFSACGACRTRRVRCDLKDLQASGANAGGPPTCSNCLERGIQCVDEYAEIKVIKQRRGRRLRQAEAVYGKASVSDSTPSKPAPSIPAPIVYKQSVIPDLQLEFFSSPFYRRFHVQRPIVDPTEFSARYHAFVQSPPQPNSSGTPGTLPPLYESPSLSIAGQILAKLLVTWAASYGVNESGVAEPHDGVEGIRRRKRRCYEMVRELLTLIDIYGLLRRPSWDGVRVLLLIMPLTEDAQAPLHRLSMYEAAVNQVYTLCSLRSVSSIKSGQGEFVDSLVRARIFWYAHVHEAITTGIRGGRLMLAEEDLAAFQLAFPPLGNNNALVRSSIIYSATYRYATAPIRLAAACRQVHAALTGPKARVKRDVDEEKLYDAWEALERSWVEFEGLRHHVPVGIIQAEDTERFVDGWQIFIFECHNVIREALKQRLATANTGGYPGAYLLEMVQPPGIRVGQAARLHAIAESKCHNVASLVVSLVRRHLGTSFFEYDASLVRDGCFFAGFLLAGEYGSEEEVQTCLRALGEMRWAFSKSEERQQSLRSVWENRKRNEELRRYADSAALGPTLPIHQILHPSPGKEDANVNSLLPSMPSSASTSLHTTAPPSIHIPSQSPTSEPSPRTGGSNDYFSQPYSPFSESHSPYTTHHNRGSTDSFSSETSQPTSGPPFYLQSSVTVGSSIVPSTHLQSSDGIGEYGFGISTPNDTSVSNSLASHVE